MRALPAATRSSGIVHPEDAELERKKTELAVLEGELAEAELELASMREEIASFIETYLERLGPSLEELAEVEAQIEEVLAAYRPHDQAAQERARESRQQADEAHRAAQLQPEHSARKGPKSERLKALFREAAKKIHPDLAPNEEERKLRTKIMAEVNEAFAAGDEARIERILRDWLSRPEAVKGEGTVAELVRAIRKIAQAQRRLGEIKTEMELLTASKWGKLLLDASRCEESGKDYFQAMEAGIKQRISDARSRLQRIAA